MEHFFFSVPPMARMIQMECPLTSPTQMPLEYSPLNPNALEFVPSYRQRSEDGNKTKTEATSTTTLAMPENAGDAVNHGENGYLVQRQIFEYLSQLGDEQMPLEEVAVSLLPGGQGLSMRFTTKQKLGQPLQLPEPKEPLFPKGYSLQLDVGDTQKLASRPESVLVAQFLFRVNDLLREKYEDGGDVSICPKCTLCSNRSYTELEIERQIEGIKAFENFPFTESTRYQDLVSHKAFKELCRKLGLIVSRDQIHINRTNSELSQTVPTPPPSTQASDANVSMDQTTNELETETDLEAYAGDDESQSNEEELTPKGSASRETSTEYVRGKIYRYEDSEGSQLVNQLNDSGPQHPEPLTDDVFDDSAHLNTPAKSLMASSMPTTFPRVYKSAKAKCSVRGAGGAKDLQSVAHRTKPYSRPVVQPPQSTVTTMQRCRGQFQAGSAAEARSAAQKLQVEGCHPASTRRHNYQRVTAPKMAELGSQQAAKMSASMAGRLTGQGRQPMAMSKPQPSHGCKSVPVKVKQQHGNAQHMVPRSTTTSLMRQSEVKRRMSLLRGESDSDMLFNEYLFK